MPKQSAKATQTHSAKAAAAQPSRSWLMPQTSQACAQSRQADWRDDRASFALAESAQTDAATIPQSAETVAKLQGRSSLDDSLRAVCSCTALCKLVAAVSFVHQYIAWRIASKHRYPFIGDRGISVHKHLPPHPDRAAFKALDAIVAPPNLHPLQLIAWAACIAGMSDGWHAFSFR